jgi:hypothetical protein
MKLTQEVQEILQLIDGKVENLQQLVDQLKEQKKPNIYHLLEDQVAVLLSLRIQITDKIIKEKLLVESES